MLQLVFFFSSVGSAGTRKGHETQMAISPHAMLKETSNPSTGNLTVCEKLIANVNSLIGEVETNRPLQIVVKKLIQRESKDLDLKARTNMIDDRDTAPRCGSAAVALICLLAKKDTHPYLSESFTGLDFFQNSDNVVSAEGDQTVIEHPELKKLKQFLTEEKDGFITLSFILREEQSPEERPDLYYNHMFTLLLCNKKLQIIQSFDKEYSARQYMEDHRPEEAFFYDSPIEFYHVFVRLLESCLSSTTDDGGQQKYFPSVEANEYHKKLFGIDLNSGAFSIKTPFKIHVTATERQDFNYEFTNSLFGDKLK